MGGRGVRRGLGIVLALSAVCLGARAGVAQEAKRGVALPTVVVTAQTRNETFQTGDVDMDETPSFYSYITRDAFEGKVESLGDVLRKEVGIQIRQSGGLGSFSTVSLRGASTEQVMVFMDGILLNDASMGGVNLANISLSDVEAIEVYRGATPMNFGKASIGGVVNIRTLRATNKPMGRVTARFGSFGTKGASAFVSNRMGKWDALVSADSLAGDNDFWILNDRGTDLNPYDDEWQKRKNNGFDQKNLLTKLGCALGDTVRLDLSNQWFAKDQEIANWVNTDCRASLDTHRNTTIAKVTADAMGPVNVSGYLDYTRKKERYDDREGEIGLGNQFNEYLTESMGGHVYLEWPLDYHLAGMMVDVRHETYSPEDLLCPDRNPLDSRRTTYTLGLQDTAYLLDERLSLTPAARYTHVDDLLQSGESYWEMHLAGQENRKDYVSPQIGVKYLLLEGATLKANLARYTREPTFFELFGDRGLFLGNDDLVAEKGVNMDAGVVFSRDFASELCRGVSFEASWFRSDMDDMITRTYDARGVGKSINISGALIEGVEARVNLGLLRWFRLIANGTWQDTTNHDRTEEFYGKSLAGRYDRAFTGRLEGLYGGVKLYGEYHYESGMYYDTACTHKSPGKRVVGAGGTWVAGPFRLELEGKNLTNDRHEDFNGYYMPGRSFYATLTYSF